MIEIKDFSVRYGRKLAVDGIDLEIRDGEIFGLIGHNGAGKSTTINSLVGIIDDFIGTITINNLDRKSDSLELKKIIGYVSDLPDKFLKLQAITLWKFIGDIYGVTGPERKKRLEYLLEKFSLSDNYFMTIEEMSHGMRQKAFIIAALLSNPKIWILDEPMTGLDPQSSYNLKQMMIDHAREGNTVIFSTHVLEVAEQLCHRIGILKNGHLIFVGSIEDLRRLHPGENLEKIYLDMVNDFDDPYFKGAPSHNKSGIESQNNIEG